MRKRIVLTDGINGKEVSWVQHGEGVAVDKRDKLPIQDTSIFFLPLVCSSRFRYAFAFSVRSSHTRSEEVCAGQLHDAMNRPAFS